LFARQTFKYAVIPPPRVAKSLSRPRPHHYRSFTITLGHTTLVRTPLDERSAGRRDLYRIKNNDHKRQTSVPPAGFEPQSQQTSGCRTTPYTARPLGSAYGDSITVNLSLNIKEFQLNTSVGDSRPLKILNIPFFSYASS